MAIFVAEILNVNCKNCICSIKILMSINCISIVQSNQSYAKLFVRLMIDAKTISAVVKYGDK